MSAAESLDSDPFLASLPKSLPVVEYGNLETKGLPCLSTDIYNSVNNLTTSTSSFVIYTVQEMKGSRFTKAFPLQMPSSNLYGRTILPKSNPITPSQLREDRFQRSQNTFGTAALPTRRPMEDGAHVSGFYHNNSNKNSRKADKERIGTLLHTERSLFLTRLSTMRVDEAEKESQEASLRRRIWILLQNSRAVFEGNRCSNLRSDEAASSIVISKHIRGMWARKQVEKLKLERSGK